MKTLIKTIMLILLVGSSVFSADAQPSSRDKLNVQTSLKELVGTYAQRKIYRQFLVEYMKECPYIDNFDVREIDPATDNHAVLWTYSVNNWDDITKFYAWINDKLKSEDGSALKNALTPYAPDYAVGGAIKVTEENKKDLARHSKSK